MPGRVEIINIALARLGESPIQSLDEGSSSANAAKMLYDAERRATLREYPWNFALKQATVARCENGAVDFNFAFALPADCLRAVRLWGADKRAVRFSVRGEVLYADETGVTLEYVADEEDGNRFDSKFVEAFSYRLASALAMPIKGSPELMGNFMNLYKTLVSDAAVQSAREERTQISDNPYIEARM
jgi:hypothetical protein